MDKLTVAMFLDKDYHLVFQKVGLAKNYLCKCSLYEKMRNLCFNTRLDSTLIRHLLIDILMHITCITHIQS